MRFEVRGWGIDGSRWVSRWDRCVEWKRRTRHMWKSPTRAHSSVTVDFSSSSSSSSLKSSVDWFYKVFLHALLFLWNNFWN